MQFHKLSIPFPWKGFILRPPSPCPWKCQLHVHFIHFLKVLTFETPPPLHLQKFPIPSVGGVWAFSGTTHFLMDSKLFPVPQHSFCHKSEVLRILSIFLFRNNRNFGVSNGCRDDIKETTIFDATNIIQNSSECEMLLKSLYLCSFRPTYL